MQVLRQIHAPGRSSCPCLPFPQTRARPDPELHWRLDRTELRVHSKGWVRGCPLSPPQSPGAAVPEPNRLRGHSGSLLSGAGWPEEGQAQPLCTQTQAAPTSPAHVASSLVTPTSQCALGHRLLPRSLMIIYLQPPGLPLCSCPHRPFLRHLGR